MSARARVLRRVLLPLLLLLALGVAVVSLASQWPAVRRSLSALTVAGVGAAAVLTLASLGMSLLTWREMLAGLGTPVPLRAGSRIFFVGQLGKYLPGSVWPVMAQMELGAAVGLPRTAVGTASLLWLGISVPGALLVGLLAVPALVSGNSPAYALLFLALPLAVGVLWPPVLNPLLARALRILRRPAPPRLGGRLVVRVALLSAAANALLGVQAAVLALDLGASGRWAVPAAVGAFSLASVAGLLALPVPAGAGVREAVLVVALSPVLPAGPALVVALVSRVLLTAGDIGVALGAGAASWRLSETSSSLRDDLGGGSAS